MSEETPRTPVDELLDRGEESGCLEFSEIAELVEENGLDEERTEAIYAEAQRRAPDLPARHLAAPPSHSRRGSGARQAHRARRPGRQEPDDRGQPAPGR